VRGAEERAQLGARRRRQVREIRAYASGHVHLRGTDGEGVDRRQERLGERRHRARLGAREHGARTITTVREHPQLTLQKPGE